MRQEQLVLRAYLREKLSEQGLEADETILNAITARIALEEGEPDESKETRAITITEDTDGTIAAKSIKLYNLMRVSLHDLFGFLLKETTIVFTEDNRLKLILSLLNLLHEFYPKLTYKFNQQDAKILLSIYALGKREFSIAEIAEAHQQKHDAAITEEQLKRSLQFFKDLYVLRYLGDGQYLLREKMTYERN